MQKLLMALMLALLIPFSLSAKDEVNPADLVVKASGLLQEAQALCENGDYDKAIEQFEEAIDAYEEAIKAYRRAKDKNSANNLKEKIKSIKEERDECKKKRKEAEDAADDPDQDTGESAD